MFYERTDLSSSLQTSTSHEHRTWIFCKGDKVRVESNEDVVIKLQENTVGWNDDLKHVNSHLFYVYVQCSICSRKHVISKRCHHNGLETKQYPDHTSDY